jgi:hypothetical protein
MTQAFLPQGASPYSSDPAPAPTDLVAPAPLANGGFAAAPANGPADPAALTAAFAGYAADVTPASATVAANLPPGSVIKPTLPPTVQVDLGPGKPQVHPALRPIPGTGTPDKQDEVYPREPQPLHTDPLVGQDKYKDKNDKGFGITGTWDTNGPKSAPRVTGAYADIPADKDTSDHIHGDPATVTAPASEGGAKPASPPPANSPTVVTIPLPQLPRTSFWGN